jgi:hypothetical protein
MAGQKAEHIYNSESFKDQIAVFQIVLETHPDIFGQLLTRRSSTSALRYIKHSAQIKHVKSEGDGNQTRLFYTSFYMEWM